MIIYIIDTTLNPAREKRFSTYPGAVKYLEDMSYRKFGQNRKQRMIMLEEIGHGYDDRESVNFVRSMQDVFEVGVVRNDAGQERRMKCDITSLGVYQKEEYGN